MNRSFHALWASTLILPGCLIAGCQTTTPSPAFGRSTTGNGQASTAYERSEAANPLHGGRKTAKSPGEGSTAPSDNLNQDAGSTDQPIHFAGQPGASRIADPARPTGIVGIYGESISRSVTSSGFGDGASNIAQVTFATEGADFDPDVDTTGEWMVFASTQHRATSDLYLKSVGGSTLTQLTSDPADDMMPEFSPDGKWIAFASNRAGQWDIYVMPVAGGQARLVSGDPSHELHPSWSPDGKRLVYCRFGEQSQRWEMWVVTVDNTAVRHFIDYGLFPEWSPDPAQNKILFQRARERGSRYHSIWTIDYVDGQGRNPTEIVSASNAAVINPTWAPDARHVVFATVIEPETSPSEKPGQSDLWAVRIDGTGRTNITNGDAANFQPAWGANGRVYFVSNRGGNDNIWSVSANWASEPRTEGDGTIVSVPDAN